MLGDPEGKVTMLEGWGRPEEAETQLGGQLSRALHLEESSEHLRLMDLLRAGTALHRPSYPDHIFSTH